MNFLKDIQRQSAFVIEASAGTGKTYTIKEIVLQVLRNEFKNDFEWSIRRMLIVTFTEKAAQELQTRIRNSIQDEIFSKESQTNSNYQIFLKRNLAEVDQADITTIHGFCNKILTRFSFELSLSRQMTLIDKSDLNKDQISEAVRNRWPKVFGDSYTKLWEVADDNLKLTQLFSEAVKAFNPYTDVFCHNSEITDFDYALRQYEKALLLKREREETVGRNWSILKEELSLAQKLKEEDFEKANKNYFTKINVAKPILKAIEKEISQSENSQKYFLLFDQLNDAKSRAKEIEGEFKTSKEDLCNAFLNLALADYHDFIDSFKSENNLITYDNMIAYVQKGLHDNKAFKNSILKLYDYGIIDEFQDTNGLQWDIFKTLFVDSKKFIAIVGDPKQSIYRFQGAMVEVYHRAKETLKKTGRAHFVTLDTNYRSSVGINQLSSDLFAKDFWFGERIDAVQTGRPEIQMVGQWPFEGKSLLSHSNDSFDQSLISTLLYYAKEIENEALQFKDAKGVVKNLKLRDLVVLTKNRDDAKSITHQLVAEGLACQFYGEQGFSDHSYWANLVLIIDGIIEYPAQMGFEKFAYNSFIDLRPKDLNNENSRLIKMELSHQIQKLKMFWESKDYGAFFRTLKKESPGLQRDFSLKGKTQENFFDQLVQSCVSYLIEKNESLLEFQITLRQWIELKQFPFMGFDDYKPELENDSIQVMTMHASKGLEFPVVFLVSASNPRVKEFKFLLNEKNQREVYRFANSEQSEINKIAEIEEYKRLLYVAYTRAVLRVHHFFKDVKSPFFFKEICASLNEIESIGELIENIPEINWVPKKIKPKEDIILKEAIKIEDSFLQSYSSIVHKEHTEDEKTSEKIEKTVWVDDGLPAGAEFGTMVHHLLEQVDWSSKDFVIDWKSQSLWPKHLSEPQQEKLKGLLDSTLDIQIDGSTLLGVKKYFCELEFYLDFKNENSTLWGFIDLVYQQGDRWYVLDWKSNRLENYNPETIQRAMEDHQYPLQAKVYTYALHQWLKKRIPGYDPQKHLGGARYVFVRGVGKNEGDGVWQYNPSVEDILQIGNSDLPSLLLKAKEEQWLQSDV